jgi:hypothetical protein
MLAFLIPSGVSSNELHGIPNINSGVVGQKDSSNVSAGISSISDEGYYSVTKSYCLFVTMVPLIWSLYL